MSARVPNLNACIPKGIPMIVTHDITPEATYPKNISQPKKINHNTFATGCLLKFKLTVLPNGANVIVANLKHCLPKGIPMIVMHKITPNKNHKIAVIIPPVIIHIILPNTLKHPFFCYLPFFISFLNYLVPNIRSPQSPSPGTIYPFSFNLSSFDAR